MLRLPKSSNCEPDMGGLWIAAGDSRPDSAFRILTQVRVCTPVKSLRRFSPQKELVPSFLSLRMRGRMITWLTLLAAAKWGRGVRAFSPPRRPHGGGGGLPVC